MYFIEFPVSATNIFPLANSEAGGQLLSEYNIRSRETVATDPSVKYPIGPSYVHSMDDFSLQSAASGSDVSSTVIQISPGRAVVNGHYVELLAPITIDIAAVNLKASQESVTELKGDLAIGLVMMYSNYTTLAGSAKPENEDGYYEGVQVVIVPETAMKRPVDVPEEYQYSEVNMHLLLGTFSYAGGKVSNVHDNLDKVKILDASRIGDISSSLSDQYLSKTGLDPHHLYVFAGKGTTDDNKDTWCLADDSLMIWDSDPRLKPNEPHSNVAHFEYNGDTHKTTLVVPHKQIDGAIDQYGNNLYFPDKVYSLPSATFNDNSGGVVTPEYTNRIKHIEYMTDHYYRIPNGKMRQYIPAISSTDELPPIPVGDGSVDQYDASQIIADITSDIVGVENQLYASSGNSALNRKLLTLKNNIAGKLTDINTAIDNIRADLQNSTSAPDIDQYLANIESVLSTTATSSDYYKLDAKLQSAYNRINSVATETTGVPDLPGCATSLTTAIARLEEPTPDIANAKSGITAVRDAILGTGSYSSTDGIIGILEKAESDILGPSASARKYTESLRDHVIANVGHIRDICGDIDTETGTIKTYCTDITTYINDITNLISTLSSCKSTLNSCVNKLNNITSSIETYIRLEVERLMDEQRVLTTSIWSPGDYVLVGQDGTMAEPDGTQPSTMYVVNYGKILTVGLVGTVEITLHTSNKDVYKQELNIARHTVPQSLAGGAELGSIDISSLEDADPDLFTYTNYCGLVNHDYFVEIYKSPIDTTTNTQEYIAVFYTPTSTELQLEYIKPPIVLTGGIHLATQESVGGFLDAPDDAYGEGYVALDEDGHLRIIDFNLLLMGIEAQQLGQDIDEIGSGLDANGIQDALDESVNDRICYPNATQRNNFTDPTTGTYTTKDPHVIEITIELPSTTDPYVLHIHDVGSRANSSLYVHLHGSATSEATILFENCDMLRIDDSIQGSPTIMLKNVNLYYNANVLSYTPLDGVQNLSLWYQQDLSDSSSPNLQVDGMTVTLLGDVSRDDAIDPWDEYNPNDNHYSYALRSITFASDGTIINFGMIVGDSSTMNVDITDHALFRASFTLPQSAGLQYPANKMVHQLKVSGSFVSCYYSTSDNKYIVKETDFSALTQKYNSPISEVGGSIAFCTNAYYVSQISGVVVGEGVDCWDLNTPHIFYGGSIE